jgi:DNA polymerase III subunit epsilon
MDRRLRGVPALDVGCLLDAGDRLSAPRNYVQGAVTYAPDFLASFDRLVAFDAETTGKRTPDAEFIKKQPFAWRPPGIVIELGFVEMLREGAGWRKGESWASLVNPDGPIEPAAIKVHGIKPNDLKHAPRFAQLLERVRGFIGESPIIAHAFRNERGFLDYEYARAKAISWEESAYPDERYICTQRLYAQLYPGAPKSLTAMCDRLVLDTSARDAKHGALLDADMTADALILLESELKHGRSEAPRSWSTQ